VCYQHHRPLRGFRGEYRLGSVRELAMHPRRVWGRAPPEWNNAISQLLYKISTKFQRLHPHLLGTARRQDGKTIVWTLSDNGVRGESKIAAIAEVQIKQRNNSASITGLSRVNGVRSSIVLKHETSTLYNFISIDFKFDVGDNVKEVTRLAKFGLDPMSGQDATWGQHIRVLWVFFVFCLFFVFFNRATAHTQFSRTIAQKTRSGVRKTLLGIRSV